jgi:hypothetical protein
VAYERVFCGGCDMQVSVLAACYLGSLIIVHVWLIFKPIASAILVFIPMACFITCGLNNLLASVEDWNKQRRALRDSIGDVSKPLRRHMILSNPNVARNAS